MSDDRRPGKRSRKFRNNQRFKSGKRQPSVKDRAGARLDPQLKTIFKKIGVPADRPFQPDPFQLEALKQLQLQDVIVSAPTGAGKTWIAAQAIQRCLEKGQRAWYASPLKALSNSIYLEFNKLFGAENCGILTGDRKENPDAAVVVGTTEILRNQLYDAMQAGENIQTDLVILDEAHYLSDPDRGVVWEETLIYLPSRVRLLLLSATISNAHEIGAWLRRNRGVSAQIVKSDQRPVPLEMLFLFPDGLLSPLSAKSGLVSRVRKFLQSRPAASGKKTAGLHYHDIIRILRDFNLLPAIFFLKSRLDCDKALSDCRPVYGAEEVKERLAGEVHLFLQRYPHLKGHRQMRPLQESLAAAHHAGQLPYWKVLVETMMNKGYLEAIFSTSTVAAGVNFPARTVVLVQSDRFNGHAFMNLTATELHQMTGRAGRRGKDQIGFALVLPGRHQDPHLIQQLRDSPPEPVRSQIRINFSMTLNLLLSLKPDEIRDLLERSFANFQERQFPSVHREYWEALIRDLEKHLPRAKCDIRDPYEIAEYVQIRKDQRRVARRSGRPKQSAVFLNALKPFLVRGRLFQHRNDGVYVLLQVLEVQGRPVLLAHNIQKMPRWRKGHLRGKRAEVSKIKSLYDYKFDFSDQDGLEEIRQRLAAIPLSGLQKIPLNMGEPQTETEADRQMPEQQERIPCQTCEHVKLCPGKARAELGKLLRGEQSAGGRLEHVAGGLWLSFKRHLRFLKAGGFVDEANRLTTDGVWASQLRLDHPLLIGEAIRRNGFQDLAPEFIAGGIAPFVWDRMQEVDFSETRADEFREMVQVLKRILSKIDNIRQMMERRGFESPRIFFWPAIALYAWAKGVGWKELLQIIPLDEGDLASLIVRTADHLRQVAGLKATHPELAARAWQAIAMIMREPVLVE